MTAVAYTRISADQTGEALGVARQLEEITALATRQGAVISAVYSDNDVSAMSGSRPAFERMLRDARAGGIDIIYVWAPDRLYRRVADLERLVEALDQVSVRTVVSGDVDLSSADGRMVARILGSVASREVERTQERLKAKHRELARNGHRGGGPTPFGWRTPEEGDVVRRITRALLSGESVRGVTKALNTDEFPAPKGGTWTQQGTRHIAMRAANAGLRAHQGALYEATWPALVSRDEWERVTRLLTAPGGRPTTVTGRVHALSGFLICGVCGGPLRHRQNSGRTPYYGCPTAHLTVPAAPVEQVVFGTAQALLDRAEIEVSADDTYTALRDRLEVLRGRLEDVATGLADGRLDVTTAGLASDRIRADIRDMEAALADQDRRSGALAQRGLKIADQSVDRQRAVLDTLGFKVTIDPIGRGRWRTQDVIDRIRIEPIDTV